MCDTSWALLMLPLSFAQFHFNLCRCHHYWLMRNVLYQCDVKVTWVSFCPNLEIEVLIFQHMNTNREVMVVAIKNFSGFIEADKDGNWSCPTDKKRKHEIFPNPVCGLTTTFSVWILWQLQWYCKVLFTHELLMNIVRLSYHVDITLCSSVTPLAKLLYFPMKIFGREVHIYVYFIVELWIYDACDAGVAHLYFYTFKGKFCYRYSW